jgi:RND family efflux transporter MFP subunit
MPEAPPPAARVNLSTRRLKLVGLIAVGVALAVAALGLFSRSRADQEQTNWTHEQSVPTVNLAVLKTGGGDNDLVLPGDVQAFNSAPIHARVSGYLKSWTADIGAQVKRGQVLAVIDSPDLDQQLDQAKADLATAVANRNLSATTEQRWSEMLAQQAVSRQDADEKSGDLAAKTALVSSAAANLHRLQALAGFKTITAPFDGVVTARNAEVGQLIAAGTPTDTPLFTVSDEHRLRIYVHVPQSYIAAIQPGLTAAVTVPEYPNRTFTATIASTAQAIADQSGTLLVELQIDNGDKALKPGEYAQVSFHLPTQTAALQVPASALLIKHSGLAVAVVGPDSRVAIRPITVARDLGLAVVVSAGLSPTDKVIDNPADTLQTGDLVRIPGASEQAHAQAAKAGANG